MKKTKRVVALLLAMSLILSIVPTTLATVADITVDFKEITWKEQSTAGRYDVVSHPSTYTIVNNRTTNCGTMGLTGSDGKIRPFFSIDGKTHGYWPSIDRRQNMVSFKINAAQAGWYTVKYSGAVHSDGTTYAIYADGKDFLGSYDSYVSGVAPTAAKAGEEKQLNAVYFSAGEHEISIRATGTSDPSPNNLYIAPEYIKFSYAGEEAPSFDEFKTEAPVLAAGESAVFEVRAIMSDGSYYSFGSLGNGKVGLSDPLVTNAALSVTATDDKLTVVTDSVELGTGGEADVIKFTLDGKLAGESGVRISGTINGETIDEEIKITVSPEREIEVTADFTAIEWTKQTGYDDRYNLKAYPGNYSIVADETTNKTMQGLTGKDGKVRPFYTVAGTTYWPDTEDKTNMLTFTLNVPKDGYYAASYSGAMHSDGVICAIYADGKDYLGNYDSYVADAPPTAAKQGEIKRLNTVYLTKGDHKISLRATGTSDPKPKNVYIAPEVFRLVRLNGVASAPVFEKVETTLSSIPIEEDVFFEAKVKMSDGSYYSFGPDGDGETGLSSPLKTNGSITVSANAANIVAESLENPADTSVFKYKLQGKEEGDSSIRFTGDILGVQFADDPLPITLTPIRDVEVTVDFTQTYGEQSTAQWTKVEHPGYDIVSEKSVGSIQTLTGADGKLRQFLSCSSTLTAGFWPQNTAKETMATIKIDVPKSGWYNVEFAGAESKSTAVLALYADGKTYIGEYSGYADKPPTAHGAPTLEKLNSIYLTQGSHEISFRATGKGDPDVALTYVYITLETLKLTSVRESELPSYSDVELELPAIIPAAEKTFCKARVKLSDGSYYHFGYNGDGAMGVSSAHDDENYLTVTATDALAEVPEGDISQYVSNSNGAVGFMLDAKTPGVTYVKVSGKVYGEEFEKTLPITIQDAARLEKVDIAAEKLSFCAGRDTVVSITLADLYGREYGRAYTTEFVVENPEEQSRISIEKIDENSCKITGISEGKVTLRAVITPTVPVDEYEEAKFAETEIKIDKEPLLTYLSILPEMSAMEVGDTQKLKVNMLLSDNLPELYRDRYQLSWEIDKPELIELDEVNQIVRAIQMGEVGIWVSTLNENGKKITSKPFVLTIGEEGSSEGTEVEDPNEGLLIDFTKTDGPEHVSQRWSTLKTPGYRVVEARSVTSVQLLTGSDGVMRPFISMSNHNTEGVWPVYKERHIMVTVEIDIPEDGYYEVFYTGADSTYGPVYAIYCDNKTYLGEYDSLGLKGPMGHTEGSRERLNTIWLTEGAHEFSFRMTTPAPRGTSAYIAPAKLHFIPVDTDEYPQAVEIKTDIPEIAVGERACATARIKMSDGSYRYFGLYGDGKKADPDNFFTVTANDDLSEVRDEDITVYKPGNRDAFEFFIRGKTPGTASLTVSGKIGGQDFSFPIEVQITDEVLDSIEVSVDKDIVFEGETANISIKNVLSSGRELDKTSGTTVYTSSDTAIAEISQDGVITAKKAGETEITVQTTFGSVTLDEKISLTVYSGSIKKIEGTAGGSKYIRLTEIPDDTVPMYIKATMADGSVHDMTGAEFKYEAITPELAEIDENGTIFPKKEGKASFYIIDERDNEEKKFKVELTVVKGKTGYTIYSQSMRDAAVENAGKYSWAKSQRESAKAITEKNIQYLEQIYLSIPSAGLPTSISVGGINDPERYFCRYCGADLATLNGVVKLMNVDPYNRPWKVQCTECKRLFPSNEFEEFFKLGLNEYGEFNRLTALENHRAMLIEKGLIDPSLPPFEPGMDVALREGASKNPENWYKYYGYGVEGGYLYNDLYSEIGTKDCPVELAATETPGRWGVDDGLGYRTGVSHYSHAGAWQYDEVHGYICFYLEHFFNNIYNATQRSYQAYLYTGERKYGYVAAILIDRLADFYPDYDLVPYMEFLDTGGDGNGKIWGNIHEAEKGYTWGEAYDAVYELYDDAFVMDFIGKMNDKYKMRHAKETPSQVRTNVEDGLLRGLLEGARNDKVNGNFGFHHSAIASVAVALDTSPDTEEWLEWLMKPGFSYRPPTGGGIVDTFIDRIDHDGAPNESSRYNVFWLNYILPMQRYIDSYVEKHGKGSTSADLKENPKFMNFLQSFFPFTMSQYTPNIGDSNKGAVSKEIWHKGSTIIDAYNYTKNPILLRYAYNVAKGDVSSYNGGIFAKDPEAIQKEILDEVEKNGDFKLPSYMMSGFGFAALRKGAINGGYENGKPKNDNRQGIWMYFGYNGGHGHGDSLNIGMDIFGHELMPDLGYGIRAGSPDRPEWNNHTLSHNTVTVYTDTGKESDDSETTQKTSTVRGDTRHFDDAGQVKIMDVDAASVYDATDIYRRSIVMVDIDDDHFYSVDFFRVRGGDSHEFSLHTQSDNICETVGLGEKESQLDENGEYIGTYAGYDEYYDKSKNNPEIMGDSYYDSNPDKADMKGYWPKGADPYATTDLVYITKYRRGYTWLDHIDRYNKVEEKIEVDFEIDDFNKSALASDGIHMRATMLGVDTSNTKVTIANGYPTQVADNKNIPCLKYLLVKRDGKGLDSMFTTVYEPYKNNRTISDIEEMPLKIKSGIEESDDVARAVRVTLRNGRVDYVFYATNNNIIYTLTDGDEVIEFRGAFGVYSVNNGVNVYKYVCDGDIIGEQLYEDDGQTPVEKAITGRISSFTEAVPNEPLPTENYITIKPSEPISDKNLEEIVGRHIFVENDGLRNAAYLIAGAKRVGDEIELYIRNRVEEDGEVVLDLGSPTLVRQLVSFMEPEQGYIYNVAKRNDVVIPLSYGDRNAPTFDTIEDCTTSANSRCTINVSAEGYEGARVTIVGRDLPRGASFDSAANTFSWKPDGSQVGENHVSLTAVDEYGRESTIHFTVTVYGSTTPNKNETVETPSDNAGASGGGGGGGGGATSDNTQSDIDTDVKNENSVPQDNAGDAPETSGEADNIRFKDLTQHSWAADAINVLAADGIIRGTSETTFSPAANITRADFALLLVRAFELSSDDTENFADVMVNDYYASELAIARNTGIVSGIGNNKYAPRNPITRQDMMVIVYRAMQKLNVEFSVYDEPQNEDFGAVAPYARDAVASLISAELVNGKNGLIAPTDYTTRAEVAVLLKRILEYTAK